MIYCALSIWWVQSWKEPCYVSYLYKHYTAVLEIFQKIRALTDSRGLSCYQAWWCVLFCSLVRFGLPWHPIWPKQKQHTFSACHWSDKRLNLHAWLIGENSVEEDRTDLGGVGRIIMILKGEKNRIATSDMQLRLWKIKYISHVIVSNMWLQKCAKHNNVKYLKTTYVSCDYSHTEVCVSL